MKTMYVYILECSDSTYYVGVTNNLDKRIMEHNEGIHESAYTFKRRPVILVYHEIFNNPIEAISFEKKIKRWSRKKKEALIKRNFSELKTLSKKKFKV